MRYELHLKILDSDYIDKLIISLARQGYSPYLTEDAVCFEVAESELTELK